MSSPSSQNPVDQSIKISLGLSQKNPCSYLANQVEQVAVATDSGLMNSDGYELLLGAGFRRSGNVVYMPHCGSCQSCQAIRLSIADSRLSKSQKRLKNKASALRWQMKPEMDEAWVDLYRRYITKRHANGSMYPPNEQAFLQFTDCNWLTTSYLHIYHEQTLIAVAITDQTTLSCSAFYTFFDPDYPLSLGTLGVLFQIDYCVSAGKQWLYLGYQIDDCAAMNYKVRFQGHQRLVNQRWRG